MMILAHRGCFGRTCTENTLEAFRAAIEKGADGIELDVRLAKDGELVVIHDANLHRVAGNAHKVKELTAAELASIPLRQGGSIPTLQEVTAAIHAPAVLDIEVKSKDAVGTLVKKLKTSAALRERTIVSSFHASALSDVARELPDVRTLLLVPRWPLPILRTRAFRTRIERLRPWAVALPILLLNQRRVKFLRRLGVHVGGWDQQRPGRDARKARKLGIDIAILRDVEPLL